MNKNLSLVALSVIYEIRARKSENAGSVMRFNQSHIAQF